MELKISHLVTASTSLSDDVFMILQGGLNKKITLTTILKNLNSTDDIRLNPNQNAIRTIVSSINNPNLIYVDGVTNKIGIGTSTLSDHILTIDGSVSYGSSTSNGILVGSSEEVSWVSTDISRALSVVRESSYISVQAGYSGVFSLSTGFDGQTKNITLVSTSSSTTTISCTGIASTFTTINMTQKGNSISLKYKGTGSIQGWAIVGNSGCTVS